MGEGVTFYSGSQNPSPGNSDTTCSQKGLVGGGPVDFYKGSPEYRSTGNTTNHTADRLSGSTPNTRPGGGPLQSPTDK